MVSPICRRKGARNLTHFFKLAVMLAKDERFEKWMNQEFPLSSASAQ
jgi:hypothetical protein